LNKTLKEVVRVLKPNRYLTLMFNTYDHRTWSELLKTIKRLGLKIEDLSTIEYSQNSVVQENKNGGLKHDFLLTFKKIP
jgi:ubiquinone/menaquinone biosynthesis C-methylase UbiE